VGVVRFPSDAPILLVAAHTDDVELGCGGTIARAIESGADVHVLVFSTVEESVPPGAPTTVLRDEFVKAMDSLGVSSDNVAVENHPVRRLNSFRQEVLDRLISLDRAIGPEVILAPASSDVHQDHQVVHAECLRAFKDRTLLGYEAPWNQVTFTTNAFVTLDERHIEAKWRALQAYQSQFELGRPYFTREFIFGLATVRGVQVKASFAEAFEAIRVRI
jgi:N-acetylglucosamine malate deacetylase 1